MREEDGADECACFFEGDDGDDDDDIVVAAVVVSLSAVDFFLFFRGGRRSFDAFAEVEASLFFLAVRLLFLFFVA